MMWWRLWVRKTRRPTIEQAMSNQADSNQEFADRFRRIEHSADLQSKATNKLRREVRGLDKRVDDWWPQLYNNDGWKTICADVRKLQAALRDMTAVIEELQKKRDFASQIKASKAQVAKFNDRLDSVDKVLRTLITGG